MKYSWYHRWKRWNGFHSQHSTGIDAVCSHSIRPSAWGIATLNTTRTLVFFRPISVSPFFSSMSALRSFKMPAQSMLWKKEIQTHHVYHNSLLYVLLKNPKAVELKKNNESASLLFASCALLAQSKFLYLSKFEMWGKGRWKDKMEC